MMSKALYLTSSLSLSKSRPILSLSTTAVRRHWPLASSLSSVSIISQHEKLHTKVHHRSCFLVPYGYSFFYNVNNNRRAGERNKSTSRNKGERRGNNPTEKNNRATLRDDDDNLMEKEESSFPPHELNVFVSCLPGLEPYLAQELHSLLGNDRSTIIICNSDVVNNTTTKSSNNITNVTITTTGTGNKNSNGDCSSDNNNSEKKKILLLPKPGGVELLTTTTTTTLSSSSIDTTKITGKNNNNKINTTNNNLVTVDDIYSFHLHLGIASHVLLRCGPSFKAYYLNQLEQKVSKFPWYQILSYFPNNDATKFTKNNNNISVTTKDSKLYHTTAIRERICNSITKSLLMHHHNKTTTTTTTNDDNNLLGNNHGNNDRDKGRSSSSSNDNNYYAHLVVRIIKNQVQISIDTSSSTPLHQRGYRLQTAKAPLREDIAYAMLYSVGWNKQGSYHHTHSGGVNIKTKHDSEETNQEQNEKPLHQILLDPFCGSGTIPIEAATMSAGLPPGRLRSPPFMGTVLYNPNKWIHLLDKYNSSSNNNTTTTTTNANKQSNNNNNNPVIFASDRDRGAIEITKENAKRAGVEDYIDIRHVSSFTNHPLLLQARSNSSSSSLLVATNPPFGKRISTKGNNNNRSRGNSNKNNRKRETKIPKLLNLYQTLIDRLMNIHNINNNYEKLQGLASSSSSAVHNGNTVLDDDIENNSDDDATTPNDNHDCSDSVNFDQNYPVQNNDSCVGGVKAIILSNDPHILRKSIVKGTIITTTQSSTASSGSSTGSIENNKNKNLTDNNKDLIQVKFSTQHGGIPVAAVCLDIDSF